MFWNTTDTQANFYIVNAAGEESASGVAVRGENLEVVTDRWRQTIHERRTDFDATANDAVPRYRRQRMWTGIADKREDIFFYRK